MSHDVQEHQGQPFEHVMATVFTCRSLVRYNLALTEEQKSDLLADIDTSLQTLRMYLFSGTSVDAKIMPMPLSLSNNPVTSSLEKAEVASAHEQSKLQDLYRIYHRYIDVRHGDAGNASVHTIGTFVARFNETITLLDEVQLLLAKNHAPYELHCYQLPTEEPVHYVKGFVADIYYSFMEFMGVLSEVLQQNEVQPETEKLTSLRNMPGVEEGQLKGQSLAPLFQAYEAHMQLNERKGSISNRVNEMTAFLEFLKESFDDSFKKRDDFVLQVNKIIRLLSDLAHILEDYEHAVSLLFYFQ